MSVVTSSLDTAQKAIGSDMDPWLGRDRLDDASAYGSV